MTNYQTVKEDVAKESQAVAQTEEEARFIAQVLCGDDTVKAPTKREIIDLWEFERTPGEDKERLKEIIEKDRMDYLDRHPDARLYDVRAKQQHGDIRHINIQAAELAMKVIEGMTDDDKKDIHFISRQVRKALGDAGMLSGDLWKMAYRQPTGERPKIKLRQHSRRGTEVHKGDTNDRTVNSERSDSKES